MGRTPNRPMCAWCKKKTDNFIYVHKMVQCFECAQQEVSALVRKRKEQNAEYMQQLRKSKGLL